MTILYVILFVVSCFYTLWVLYLAVMNLKRVRDLKGLNKVSRVLGTPVLILGYALDIFINIFIMSVILLELPKEITVSSRLKRHNNTSTDWRKKVVLWFEPLLDPYDPSGDHI